MPESAPASSNRLRIARIGFVGSDVIAYIFATLKKISLSVVPYHDVIYPCRKTGGEPGPTTFDVSGISGVSFVLCNVVPDIL